MPSRKPQLSSAKSKKKSVLWQPNPGPQTSLFSCPADVILYGGAKAGGKSEAMIMCAARHIDKDGYRAIIFRRTFPELERHIIPRSQELFSGIGRYDGKNHKWTFVTPNGGRSTIEFSYLERESDIFSYQGSQYAFIGFDESTLFSEQVIRLMWTCLRSTVPDIPRQMLLTSNPVGPGFGWHKLMFIKDRINKHIYQDACWPSDGKSVGGTTCFIQARVWDNPVLLQMDPKYPDKLSSQSESVKRALLDGSWDETVYMAFAFDNYVHTCKPIPLPEDCPRWMGIDWGKEDKAATVWMAYHQGRVYAYRDHSRPGKLIVPYAQEIVDICKGENINYCVLSHECFSHHGTGNTQADQFIQVLNKAKIPVIKSDKDAEGRLMLMREYLRTVKKPELIVARGMQGDYKYWMDKFNKEGIRAWEDFRKFGNDNDESLLPKLKIFQPGLVTEVRNDKQIQVSYGCPDLITALPLLVTDEERKGLSGARVLADNQDDHSYDACGYGLKAWVVNDEVSLMEAYQQQLNGRMPDSLLAAHHAMEAAKESVKGDDEMESVSWQGQSYGQERSSDDLW